MAACGRSKEGEQTATIGNREYVYEPVENWAKTAARLSATANTIGFGDTSGIHQGTQQINHGQMDRWNVVARLGYLAHDVEVEIVAARVPAFADDEGRVLLGRMERLADLTRQGFRAGNVSTLISPCTIISWAENTRIFASLPFAFLVTFLSKFATRQSAWSSPSTTSGQLAKLSSLTPTPRARCRKDPQIPTELIQRRR